MRLTVSDEQQTGLKVHANDAVGGEVLVVVVSSLKCDDLGVFVRRLLSVLSISAVSRGRWMRALHATLCSHHVHLLLSTWYLVSFSTHLTISRECLACCHYPAFTLDERGEGGRGGHAADRPPGRVHILISSVQNPHSDQNPLLHDRIPVLLQYRLSRSRSSHCFGRPYVLNGFESAHAEHRRY